MTLQELTEIIEKISNIEDYAALAEIDRRVVLQRNYLRAKRVDACLWFECNGEIVDDKCNMCSQSYNKKEDRKQ
jgi:hypothetical protein